MARLTGTNGPDTLFGTQANDRIYGLGSTHSLVGNDGNDRIYGGIGYDFRLFGGSGSDQIFGGLDRDLILCGDSGNDRILGEGGSGAFIGASDFTGNGTPEARFVDRGSNDGRLQVDVDGDGNANFSARLEGVTAVSQLTSSDFLFV